jgi:hypothetical protein
MNKSTETGTYWNGNGRHQELYDRLYTELVPDSGPADTYYGEILRAISNVYYDVYNNGCANLAFSMREDVETVVDWRGLRIVDGKRAQNVLRDALTALDYPFDDEDDDDASPFDGLVDSDPFLSDLESLTDAIILWVDTEQKR